MANAVHPVESGVNRRRAPGGRSGPASAAPWGSATCLSVDRLSIPP